MLNQQQEIDTVKNLASSDFNFNIARIYGSTGVSNLKVVLDAIHHIFKNLNIKNFNSIYIFKSDSFNFSSKHSPSNIQNYSHITSISGPNIIIKINRPGDISVCSSEMDFDIENILETDFVYQHKNGEDIFHTKEGPYTLPMAIGSDSWFAIATFKELNEALFHYKTTVACNADCRDIQESLLDENRIYFAPQPEHFLRDSLIYFLRVRLRGEGLEIRPEQIVDTSHPVDIKIIWGSTNHIALIEIKWLGKSFKLETKSFTTEYSESRARDGAEQLAEYLDANKLQVPNHNTIGYLVVFDLRRRGTSNYVDVINKENGLWYKDREIAYDPEYHIERNDFATPVRMFIEPRCTNEN